MPPSTCGELKWVKMLDLRALSRRNLVFSIDGDHVHLHGCASISFYFENFVCRWFSDHPLLCVSSPVEVARNDFLA